MKQKQKHITITLALTMCLVSACNKKTNEQEEKIKSVGYVDTTIEKEHDCSVHEGEEHSQHEHTENEHSEDEYEPVSKNGTAIKDVVGDFDEEDTQKALGKPTSAGEDVEK